MDEIFDIVEDETLDLDENNEEVEIEKEEPQKKKS